MKITIFGGGFGLYGYLPALLASPETIVILPLRYRPILSSRADIAHLQAQIIWAEDHLSILNECQAVIFALPPEAQYDWIKKIINYPNITHFFLEKPLASTPALGEDLFTLLSSARKKFRIGYNFRFTSWGQTVLRGEPVRKITWHFRAHHYAKSLQTWKREHSAGGGALRFYGIHLIALLAEMGYRQVNFSKLTEKAACWEAELSGEGLPDCYLSINSNSDETYFSVLNDAGVVFHATDPFTTESALTTEMDQRIPFLKQGLSNLFTETDTYYDWYKHTHQLWQTIEKQTS